MIATASTEEKRALALELGADVAIDGAPEGLTERLVEANGGSRVDVVLEAIGGAVFDASLEALAPFGRLVTYGDLRRARRTSRNTRELMRALAHRRRLLVPGTAWSRPELLDEPLADLFARVGRGELRPLVGGDLSAGARPPRRRSTSPSAARPGRCCWTRPLAARRDSRGARPTSTSLHVDRMTTFADLGLSAPLLEALEDVGYEQPEPDPGAGDPAAARGHDIIGQAQTGSGKTAAFGLPIMEYVDPGLHDVQALVLTPTRELCIQVTQALRAYGARRASTSSPSSAARRSAPSRPSCAPAVTSSSAPSAACWT